LDQHRISWRLHLVFSVSQSSLHVKQACGLLVALCFRRFENQRAAAAIEASAALCMALQSSSVDVKHAALTALSGEFHPFNNQPTNPSF
jgi:hypothetical protein